METEVLLSDLAQQLRRENISLPEVYSTLPDVCEIQNELLCIDLGYIDELATDKNVGKYLLVRQDVSD